MITQEELNQISVIISNQIDKIIKLSTKEIAPFSTITNDLENSIESLSYQLITLQVKEIEIKRKILCLIRHGQNQNHYLF